MRLLGLDLPVPDRTTFSRCSANLEVASALTKADGPVTVVIDPTGLKVFGKGEWHLEKHGGHARRSWRKLHLAVNPDTGEILASALTSNEDGERFAGRPTARPDRPSGGHGAGGRRRRRRRARLPRRGCPQPRSGGDHPAALERGAERRDRERPHAA